MALLSLLYTLPIYVCAYVSTWVCMYVYTCGCLCQVVPHCPLSCLRPSSGDNFCGLLLSSAFLPSSVDCISSQQHVPEATHRPLLSILEQGARAAAYMGIQRRYLQALREVCGTGESRQVLAVAQAAVHGAEVGSRRRRACHILLSAEFISIDASSKDSMGVRRGGGHG